MQLKLAPANLFRMLLTLWIIIFSAVVAVNSHDARSQARKGAVALKALCVFKDDLQTRVDSSRDFLKEHPSGIPGIPASAIQTALLNQQATIRSLDNLNPYCTDGEVVKNP